MHSRGRQPVGRGFTLIELLAVIALIVLLMSLLLPAISISRSKALRVPCASNLRQLYTLCIGFAADNDKVLPHSLPENPQQLNSKTNYTNFQAVNAYMKTYGYPPSIWFCPALNKLRCGDESSWGNASYYDDGTAGSTGTPGEFPIGYAYSGNPYNNGSVYKYIDDPPMNLDDLIRTNAAIARDYCRAPRPSPLPAMQVPEWDVFPHYGDRMPSVCQSLRGDGAITVKKLVEMRQQYNYIAPYELYW